MKKNSDLIHYSRAGDIFHYRWAVKRCLELLDFNTDLQHITIEGSQECGLAGECVVDLAEYRQSSKGDRRVEYFQLKHSTVRADTPFTLSELKETIEGFAKRYSELTRSIQILKNVKFTVLTNRLISRNFKKYIEKIASGENAPDGFTKTLEEYTNFKGQKLKKFCECLQLCDSEGNYDEQKYDIHKELAKLSVSKNILDREKLLVAKVWEKIEPGQSNVIKREDMLEAFDVISFDDFFPAPPLFEPIDNYIPRDEQTCIVASIKSATTHTIITANGGVGKSILSSNLFTEFNEPSIVIAYDCFGNGSYRRTSAKRHEAKYALTQVINTLAKEGLCDQIIPTRNEPDEHWIKAFLNRIREVCTTLSAQDESAFLVLIFDAADNAEMAAEEHGGTCFVSQLLKEVVPDNCRLVFTCRPERLDLLDPPSSIKPIQLSPFSNDETLVNLQAKYSASTIEQATEFNRLTGGNPRVQSNALSLKISSLSNLLLSFGSKVLTVEDLIERQLEESIFRIKDEFPKNYRESIDSICIGLAVLPPFVPIAVLAKAANVSTDSVKSFIADLGHPLWQIDDTVQFRDEPTEKWFQDNYSTTPEKIYSFVNAIKPLATEFPYVSESLPLLLLKAEQLDELVELALSENFLPSISSFDDNQVKVQRLQYAFKAALKTNRLYEAAKLALTAGEEIAGNDRQIDILTNNVDLASLFLSPGRIQELAHRKELSGSWDGSETVFAASLLSSVSGLKGEAYSYYRSAVHWLRRYFQKRNEAKDEKERFNEKLEDIEIVELAFALYRIKGWKKCADFLLSWSPSSCIYRITSRCTERLIDAGDFEHIEKMANYGKHNPSFIIAITSELMKVGKPSPRACLTRCLNQIIKPKSKLDKPSESFHNTGFTADAYLSFFEACLIHDLPIANIRRGVNYYFNFPMCYRVADDHQYDGVRESLLRYLSIHAALKGDFDLSLDNYIPSSWSSKNDSYEAKRELERAKEQVGKLLPWYMVRAKVLSGIDINLKKEHESANNISSKIGYSSYREYEPVPFEITKAKFENILFCNSDFLEEQALFVKNYNDNKLKVSFVDDFYFLRASCRNDKLLELSESIEEHCYSSLRNYDYDESPESRSEHFIKLSRAVLCVGRDDAASYFDEALNKALDFGEEGVIRWEALTSIAKRSSQSGVNNPALAHRYMRCAEMIGDSVAREKYWDRNDAVSTCFQLSSESTFPILSRWKDRNVGWHERQIYALAHNAVDSDLASPASLWSLSSFSWEYGLFDFLKKCLAKDHSKHNQQRMLDDYVRVLRTQGIVGDKWIEIHKLATQYKLECITYDEVKRLAASLKQDRAGSLPSVMKKEETEEYQWDKLYGQFDLSTDAGFRDAFQCYENQGYPRKSEQFWRGCYKKITSRRLRSFLDVISQSEQLDFYDLRWAFENIPDAWKNKVSVEKFWNDSVKYIASRYPTRFTTIYERDYMLNSFFLNEGTNVAIKEGVIKGLSNSVDIESASALFSFAHYSASNLNIAEAQELIDFGLSRLERHIEEDYADGSWNDSIQVPKNLSHALVCYIYVNLGSPQAEERWRAVHAVRRLYKLNCQPEINLLIECYNEGLPKYYVPTKYTFYNLHAKLYLLVALTRCASECTNLLIDNKNLFSEIALNNECGILFKYYGKQICLSLQQFRPDCFDRSTFEKLQKVCVSPHSTINENKYRYCVDSPWHKKNTLGDLQEVWFAYDFDRYWFEPLGRVFGIPSEQVEDLAKDVLFNCWEMSFESSHIPDSRADLWKNRRNWHDIESSHSSYPKIDNYRFYISYHLMLEVAFKLLEAMPVIQGEDDDVNCWDAWLNKHLILNKNGILLSELRDPIPIYKPDWLNEKYDEEWPWQIVETDFIDQLIAKDKSSTWLNVEGCWDEYKDGRNEHISFSTILVPKELSQSLLHTTANFDSHIGECYLYNFCDSDYDYQNNQKFRCKQWLIADGEINDIEPKDPFSGIIYAQPYKLSQCVTEVINVTYSEDEKSCTLLSDHSICLENKYWSEDKPNDPDFYISSGSPASASLNFLKLICDQLDVDIAIQVNIQRTFKGSYRNRNKDDELGYIPRYSKTFILSGDGKLRDTRKSYQFR
ncbi:NACHT domain-containing protein [Vibrio crassostreae]|uniref:hypothetical protein n=1 Tax=Vibrio crassostreae TaxID=246167 RepID=UPI0005DD24D6|nr:hypothetical protein [Vibrio crassostreae]TCT63349.1 hypothetical protein EDB44_10694 [Vibrio crassostreae]TCT84170.1 hypothetical protein EDB43_106114 [Vibrio crassostreae]TCU04620.1 hypothetical protein EDB47_10794 [Vibrio crassostreae]CAK1715558.1 NACHT domain-containing protein [Vibrio crassostreae]CAK1717593.1 NACHT domain-containing protein [Vibrio crassostreae]